MKNTLLFPLGALMFVSCSNNRKEKEPEQPNVLFIIVDDLRPELNCYGKTLIKSPNIDKLASEGVLFSRAYCNIPVSGASRASLLTGARPTRNRFIDFATYADEDIPGVECLPQLLKNNGYYTISNGKVFHNKEDRKESWDDNWRPPRSASPRDYLSPANIALDNVNRQRGPAYESIDVPDTAYADGKILQKSIADLKKLKSLNKPFFLAVGFLKPHLPFNAPKKYWDLYDRNEIHLPYNNYVPTDAPKESIHNSGELRSYNGIPADGPLADSLAISLIHGYYACVSFTDHQIGELLKTLEELDLEKNTIVVLLGDHGWNLSEHTLWCKHCNFNTSLRSTLIVKVPWISKNKGTVCKELVEFVDVYPTLTELAKIQLPGHLEGKSFIPQLIDPETPGKKFAISKFHDGLTLTTDGYSYTEWSKTDSTIYARMMYYNYLDPDENVNISEKEENLSIIDSLKNVLYDKRGKDFNSKTIKVRE